MIMRKSTYLNQDQYVRYNSNTKKHITIVAIIEDNVNGKILLIIT